MAFISVGISSGSVLGPIDPTDPATLPPDVAGSDLGPVAESAGGGPLPLGSPPGATTIVKPFDNLRGGPDARRPKLDFSATDPDANDIYYHAQIDDNSDFQSTYIDRTSSNALNLVSDGGAEFGDMSQWTVTSNDPGFPQRNTVLADVKTGAGSFKLGDGMALAGGRDVMKQIVAIPKNATSVYLTVDYHSTGADSGDQLFIYVYNKDCATGVSSLLGNLPTSNSPWNTANGSLTQGTDRRGSEICLYIAQESTLATSSSWFVDNIAVTAYGMVTSGFTNTQNGADASPFTSGNIIRFQPGFDLAEGTVYFWRIHAIDSSGVWNAWTSGRSFWIDSSLLEIRWGQTVRDQFLTDTIAGAATASTFGNGAVQVVGSSGSATSTPIRFSNGPATTSWERVVWTESEAAGGSVTLAAQRNPTADSNCNGGTWIWATATASGSPMSLRSLSAEPCIRMVANLSSPAATTSYLLDWTVLWATQPNVDSLTVKHGGRSLSDGDRLYAGHVEVFEAKVTDPNGGADINRVDLWLGSSTHIARWTESSDTFLEAAGGADYELLSDSADTTLTGNQWSIVFEVRFPWNFPKADLILDPRVDVVDDASNSDTEVFVANSFLVENDLLLRETGLLLHDRFDEGIGTTAGDSSGLRHTGTFLGNTAWTAGRLGAATSFDGVDDAVDHGVTTRLNPSGGLTLEAWVKVAGSTGTDQAAISRWDSAGGVDQRSYVLGMSASNSFLFGISTDGASATLAIAPGTVTYGAWYHVAGTWDGTTLRLFVDGAQVATASAGSIKSSPATRTAIGAIIGRVGDPIAYELTGVVEEARIYDRAVTSAEFLERVGFRNNDGRTGLVAEFLADDGGGTLSNDSSGIAPAAMLENSPTWVPGKVGKALSFTGSPTFSRARLRNLALDDTMSGAKTTVEFWMNWTGTEGGMPFGWTPGDFYDLWFSSSCFGFNTGASDIFGFYSAGLAGSWHHVAAVFNNGPVNRDTVAIYVDGVPQDLFTCAGSVHNNRNVSKWAVISGAGNFPSSWEFSGSVDELRIWNRALSPFEVARRAGAPTLIGIGGQVAYYQFNEFTGSLVLDSSGKGNTGIAVGGAAWKMGRVGGALDFDGTDDVVGLGTDSSLNPALSITVEAWVRVDGGIGSFQTVVGRYDTGADAESSYILLMNTAGKAEFWVTRDGTPATLAIAADPVAVTLGTWYHYAGTWDGASVKLYRNGGLVATVAQSGMKTSPLVRAAIGAAIGKTGDPFVAPFNGMIDEVHIWNRALTAGQITERAALMAIDAEEALVLGLMLNEQSGTSVFDSSGKGHTGAHAGNPTRLFGRQGHGLDLDGFDDSVIVPNPIDLDPPVGLSVEAWLKADVFEAYDRIVDKSVHPTEPSGYGGYSLVMGDPGANNVAFQLYNPSVEPYRVCGPSVGSLALGSWQHYVGTYDGYTVRVYIDGALACTNTYGSSMPPVATSRDLGIGVRPGFGNNLDGKVDEVRVYSKALTPAEVAARYSAPRAVDPYGVRGVAAAQGALLSGFSWADGGETVTYSTVSVYYENSTIGPLDADYDLKVENDDGTSAVQTTGAFPGPGPDPDGSALSLSLATNAGDDTTDAHDLRIINVPGGGPHRGRTFDVKVDSHAPPAPLIVRANGASPSPWSDVDSFSVDIAEPADHSGIKSGRYKLDSIPTSPTDGTLVASHPFAVSVGTSGEHIAYVWLQDTVGNIDHQNRSEVTLRLDQVPPSFLGYEVLVDGTWQPLSAWHYQNRTPYLRAILSAGLSGLDTSFAGFNYRFTGDGTLDTEPYNFAHSPGLLSSQTVGWNPVEHCDSAAAQAQWLHGAQPAGYYVSGGDSWFVDDVGTASTEVLISPVIPIAGGAFNAKVRFFHRMNSGAGEQGWLEYKVNGGAWTYADGGGFQTGGYNSASADASYCGTYAPGDSAGADVWGDAIDNGVGGMAEVIYLVPSAAIGGTFQWRLVYRTDTAGVAAEPNGWWADSFEAWGNYIPSFHTCPAMSGCSAPNGATGTVYAMFPSVPFTADTTSSNNLFQVRARKTSGPSTQVDDLAVVVNVDATVPVITVNDPFYSQSSNPSPAGWVDVDFSDDASKLDKVEYRFEQGSEYTPWYTLYSGLGGVASKTEEFNIWTKAPVGTSLVRFRATDVAGLTTEDLGVEYVVVGEAVAISLRLGTNLVGWSATLTSAYGNLTLAQFGRAIRNSTGQVPVEVAIYNTATGWISQLSDNGILYSGVTDPIIEDGDGILVRMTGVAGSYPVAFAGTGRAITSPVNLPMGGGAFAITIPEKTGGGSYTGTTLLDAISADMPGDCYDADSRCAYNVLKFDATAQQWMQVTWDCSFFCGYSWSHEDFSVGTGDAVFVFISGGGFTFTP